MKAKTKFNKIYYKLPNKARLLLVYEPYSNTPMSLHILAMEINQDTQLGKDTLKRLGFEDD